MNLKRSIVSVLKDATFSGGLYLCGSLFTVSCHVPPEKLTIQTFWLVLFLLLAFMVFLLWSRFFAAARQWLKPLWLPALLLWRIPYTGMMAASSVRGTWR